MTRSMQLIGGKMTDYGLPEPDHLIGEAHPTLSDDLPNLVKSKKVSMHPRIHAFSEKLIRFEDGTEAEFDALIYCTGYDIHFPFLAADEVPLEDNRLPLFLRIFSPQRPNLFFIGLAQTIGPIIPVAEKQAELLAAHLAGQYQLPPLEEMEAQMQEEQKSIALRFVKSRRHTMQVDPPFYLNKLAKERKRGLVRSVRK